MSSDQQAPPLKPPFGEILDPRIAWILLAIVMIGVSAIRYRMAPIVLERDEGEYAYMGQLLLGGVPPYKIAANMKWPGTYISYALGMAVFGQTAEGIHYFLLVVNLATILFMFLLGRRIGGSLCGFVAATVFGIFTLNPYLSGHAAHASNFVVLAAVVGMWLFERARARARRPAYFAAGVAMGIAALMKQPGLYFAVMGGILTVGLTPWRDGWMNALGRGVAYSAGVLAPLVLTAIWLMASGVWEQFWFWTVQYAVTYGSHYNSATAFHIMRTALVNKLLLWNELLILLAFAGFLAPYWTARFAERKLFVWVLVFCSFMALSVGSMYRGHYFHLVAPALGLLAGMGTVSLAEALLPAWGGRAVLASLLLVAVCLVRPVNNIWHLAVQTPLLEFSLAFYWPNPFDESPEIARYLREHTEPDDLIAVIGSEPQIYFLSHRRSATQFIYTYALMEKQPYAEQMQEQMIAEVEAAKPKYLVVNSSHASWLRTQDSPSRIFDWINEYADRHYELVGVICPRQGALGEFYWDKQALTAPRGVPHTVSVYRRKESTAKAPAARADTKAGPVR